jgi:hypothetical protein
VTRVDIDPITQESSFLMAIEDGSALSRAFPVWSESDLGFPDAAVM